MATKYYQAPFSTLLQSFSLHPPPFSMGGKKAEAISFQVTLFLSHFLLLFSQLSCSSPFLSLFQFATLPPSLLPSISPSQPTLYGTVLRIWYKSPISSSFNEGAGEKGVRSNPQGCIFKLFASLPPISLLPPLSAHNSEEYVSGEQEEMLGGHFLGILKSGFFLIFCISA